MVSVAQFLGISCKTLDLTNVSEYSEILKKTVPEQQSCFVVNPRVLKQWVEAGGISADFAAFLLCHFSYLLVHGLRVDAFDSELVKALSQGKLNSVDAITGSNHVYAVARDSRNICESFSGLSFGPVNPGNDHVLGTSGNDPEVKQLISIDGKPFMAAVKLDRCECLFVASEEVVDLSAEVGAAPLAEYFSRLMPLSMALRYVAGEECFRPRKAHATIVIDDPLLRKSYGYLDFGSLLRLANQHNFHTAIAFIPHNYRRNASPITRMFQENAARLSIFFHGNDHTEAEFASTDSDFLGSLVHCAEDRMELLQQTTGLRSDRVMAFPQGRFSTNAMSVLKSRNFFAAVNSVQHPYGKPVRLTIRELAQPAVLRYGGFPLFIRNPISRTQNCDVAFNLFFGRPVLIGEHHEIFQHPELLIEIAGRINFLAPEINWSNLATVVSNSILSRRDPDGTYQVRAYSGTVRVENDSDRSRRYSIEWGGCSDASSIEQVLVDGVPCGAYVIDGSMLRFAVDLAPGDSREFSLVHRNEFAFTAALGLRWKVRSLLRRRLSEFRDNYLSKHRFLLMVATALQQRFFRI